jgi:hypothetical protein
MAATSHKYPTLLTAVSTLSQSESESELFYDWRYTANQFVLETRPLTLTTSNFIFQLNTYEYSPQVIPSLSFTIAVGPATAKVGVPRDSRFNSPPPGGWPSYTPRHWVPFPSPPTTRRVTVEVFHPASTRTSYIDKKNSKSHCDWRTVSQSLCRTPSGVHDQKFITVWQSGPCLCGAPFLTRGRVCLFW